jgi:outer membrane protein assembly factor BamB
LDANTGQLVWKQHKAGNAGYIANYYEGRLYHSASSTELTCYNAATGEILFRQDEGGRAFFVFGDSLAYGRYYGKNIALPNSYLGCWDAYTGEPLWKTPGLYNIAYLIPQVADGKMYCMRYSGTAGGEESQGTRFACLDAFTGDILWEMPGTNWAEPMIAYGNLYAVSGGTVYCVGDTDIPFEKFHDGYNFTLPLSNPGVLMGQVGPTDIRTPLWASGQYGAITGSAVAANGRVYFGSLDKNIYCVDANSGAKIWQFTTGYRVASTPTIVGGVLYTGSDDGSVYALDANTGAQLWRTSTGGKTEVFWISAWQLRSSPIVDGGQLFVGALDGKLYCLSTTNGNVLWSSFAGNATYPIGGTPCVTSDAVYIAAGDSFFYAFNRNTGALLWKNQVQPTSGFDIRAQTSTPVFDRGYLWLPTDTHTVSRIDAATGEIKTQLYLNYSRGGTMTPAITTPAIAIVGGRTVMYIGDGFQLDAYDITTFSYNSSFFLQSNVSISNSAFGTPLIQERAFYRFANGTVAYISGATSNLTL